MFSSYPRTVIGYDKSFLQSLSKEEADTLSVICTTNVTPLLIVEICADLAKEKKSSQEQQALTSTLCSKLPSHYHGYNMSHTELCIRELMGEAIDMFSFRPQIITEMHELHEYGRLEWCKGNFNNNTLDFAKNYRDILKSTKQEFPHFREQYGEKPCFKDFRDLAEIKQYADLTMKRRSQPYSMIKWICDHFEVLPEHREFIIERWKNLGAPYIYDYAPYTAHIMMVNVFKHTAMTTDHVSPCRPSNNIDLSYLYYLPFMEIFISNDNLHKKAFPLFLQKQQKFMFGQDVKMYLKKMLSKVNALTV